MARIARLVVPGLPHHVTQRGNRRELVFFEDGDYLAYLDFLRSALAQSNSEVWAWCLMPNHVHLIVMPNDEDGLRKTVANAHRKYASFTNHATNGQGICGKGGLALWLWMKHICTMLLPMSHSIRFVLVW